MILNIEEAIAARQAQKSEQLEGEFRKLVIELSVSNVAPDPDSLIAKLQRLGKSSAELQTALDRLRERRRLVAVLAAVPQHRENYAKAHAELNEEIARFAPIQAAHEERLRQLRALRSEAQSGEREGSTADQRLRGELLDPALLVAIADGATRLNRLDQAIQKCGWDIETAENAIRDEPERWRQAYGSLDPDGVQEHVERMTEQLAKLRTEQERLKALRPPMVEELAKLREQSLTVEAF